MIKSPNNDLPNPQVEAADVKNKKAIKIMLIIISVLAALFLMLFAAFLIIRAYGKDRLLGQKIDVSAPVDLIEDAEEDGTAVTYNGQKYVYNENIVSILCMGVDKQSIVDDSVYGNNGQADCIFVAALDTKTGAVKIIPISREMMADVNIYSKDGNYSGIKNTQICLAYAYGSSGAESCENVRKSVSRLLYGVNISSYIAIDLEGIKAVVNAAGGVNVTALETLKLKNFSITQGQNVLLNGDKAIFYIRARGDDLDANNRRMLRQKQFLTATASKLGNQVLSNFTKLASYYNTAKPYIVSDLTFSEITFLASACLTADIGNSMQFSGITGTSALVDGHVQFTPDKASVYDTVINTFYSKVTESKK